MMSPSRNRLPAALPWPAWWLFLLWCVPAAQAARPTAPWPPVYAHSLEGAVYPDSPVLQPRPGGGARAFSLAVAMALLQRLGRPAPVSVVPLARALRVLDGPQPALLVGLFRTPAREQRYQWLVPLYRDQLVFYQARQRPVAASSWQQARDVPVCVVPGSAPEEYALQAGMQRIERNNGYALCLRMLMAGRVQLAPLLAGDLPAKLAEAGLPAVAVQPSALPALPLESYLAASRWTPAAEVRAWRQAWQQLQASDDYRQLRQRYWP